MNNIIENFLKRLDILPDLLEGKHLIDLGLYGHKNGVYRARAKGKSPNFIKLPGRVVYPKEAVREFILQRYHDGSIPKTQSTSELGE